MTRSPCHMGCTMVFKILVPHATWAVQCFSKYKLCQASPWLVCQQNWFIRNAKFLDKSIRTCSDTIPINSDLEPYQPPTAFCLTLAILFLVSLLSSCYILHPFFVIFDSLSSSLLLFIPFHSTNLHSTTSHSFPFISPPLPQDIQTDCKTMKKIFN